MQKMLDKLAAEAIPNTIIVAITCARLIVYRRLLLLIFTFFVFFIMVLLPALHIDAILEGILR